MIKVEYKQTSEVFMKGVWQASSSETSEVYKMFVCQAGSLETSEVWIEVKTRSEPDMI
jgi:hypothetical protein